MIVKQAKAGIVSCFLALTVLSVNIPAVYVDPVLGEESMADNPYGVLEFLHWNHSWNNYKYAGKEELEKSIILVKQAGIGWIRMDFLWQDIEPEQGKFDFQRYDLIVDLCAKHGIKILGIFNYSVSWAAPDGQWNNPPLDNQVFVNYAEKVISRYKDRVKYWEVWNEPDSNVYWSRQDGLKSYCSLLKDVYLAAKKIDPECKILNGGLANGLLSVNRLYENGGKGYFDILNIHYFDTPLREDSLKSVAAYPKLVCKVMKRNGDGDKKIWITETGCPGVKEGAVVKNWWLGNNPGEEQQAQWVREVFTHLLRVEGVEKVFWAFFRDCDQHWGDGTDYLGLVRWDFSEKPAYRALKEKIGEY